jgi:hypothetical protein
MLLIITTLPVVVTTRVIAGETPAVPGYGFDSLRHGAIAGETPAVPGNAFGSLRRGAMPEPEPAPEPEPEPAQSSFWTFL